MKFYSQRGNFTKIGNTNYTIDKLGCLCVCWAMVTDTDPNYIARQPVFNSKAVLVSPGKLAGILGTEYSSIHFRALYDPVICKVRIGKSQHFVVRYNGRIYDPYTRDGKPYKNYSIISYRNVKPKGGNMGKVVWDNGVEVIFTKGQVEEMSNAFKLKHIYTGNESWGFVQACEANVIKKISSLITDKNNLIKGSKDKVTEINLLKKKNETIMEEYDKQLKRANLAEEQLRACEKKLIKCQKGIRVPVKDKNALERAVASVVTWLRGILKR